MTLDRLLARQKAVIRKIPTGKTLAQLLRFGISEGTEVGCVEVIPGGPVVIEHRRQEIAIGRKLAQSITVDLVRANRQQSKAGGAA